MQTSNITIRRGADVVGPDGPLGNVAHVVVDEATRQITELVVRSTDGHEWVVPVSAIAGATDQTLQLRSGWSELSSSAYEYAPQEFESLRGVEVPRGRQTDSLELREEELSVRKQRQERGAVELRKEVVAERKEVDVPVWHEQLILERERLEPPIPTDARVGQQEYVRVVLQEEVAIAHKQPVVD